MQVHDHPFRSADNTELLEVYDDKAERDARYKQLRDGNRADAAAQPDEASRRDAVRFFSRSSKTVGGWRLYAVEQRRPVRVRANSGADVLAGIRRDAAAAGGRVAVVPMFDR